MNHPSASSATSTWYAPGRALPAPPADPTDAELAALAASDSPWRTPTERLLHLPPLESLPSGDELQARIARVLASEHLPHRRERQGHLVEHDLRPLILDLWLPR